MGATIDLTTFSAVLTFAIELESELARFYEAAASVGGDLAETFEDYARKSNKRRQRLVATRQDNVTEIVLEPISGLNTADYAVSAAAPADRQSALSGAIAMEQRAKKFYLEAGPKLNVTEPRRAFQKLAQENEERLGTLSQANG